MRSHFFFIGRFGLLLATIIAGVLLYLSDRAAIQAETQSETNERRFFEQIDDEDLLGVRYMLASGVDPNIRDANGLTPLMRLLNKEARPRYARDLRDVLKSEEIQLRILVVLLQEGALPDLQDPCDDTALHYAIKNGHEPAARYLLMAGADAAHPGRGDRTPLDRFIKAYVEPIERIRQPQPIEQEFYETLITRALDGVSDQKAKQSYLQRLLAGAVYSQHYEAIGFLLNAGARAQQRDSVASLLHYLADDGDSKAINAIRAFLQRGAIATDPNSPFSPYHAAADVGNQAALQLFHEAGVPIDARDNEGATALMRAAQQMQTETVRYLLAKDAGVHVRDRSGKTPLMHATLPGNTAVLRQLLKAGGRLETRDEAGAPALLHAARNIAIKPKPPSRPSIRQGIPFDSQRVWEVSETRVGAADLADANQMRTRIKEAMPIREESLLKKIEEIPKSEADAIPIYPDSFEFLLKEGARMDVRDSQGRGLIDYMPAKARAPFERLLKAYDASLREKQGPGTDPNP